jgi:cytochrome P450
MRTAAVAAVRRLRRDPIGFLAGLDGEGAFARCVVGRRPVFMALEPAVIREALVTRQRELVKEQVVDAGRPRSVPEKAGFLTGNQPASHERGRAVLRPSFTREQTAQHVRPFVIAEARRLCEAWPGLGIVDVGTHLTRSMMQIAAVTLFGVEIPDPAAAENDMHVLLDEFNLVSSPFLRARGAFNVPRGTRFMRSLGRIDELGTQLLNAPGRVATALRESGLDPALAAKEARNIVLAGTETTAIVLTWALRELALDRALADALADEGEPLAERIFDETLRLYPPAWFISRIAMTATELAGQAIDEGTAVLASPYLLHRDERYYPEPERFDPERWREGTAAGTRAFTFIPFGAGRRRCIGEEIAMLEGRVMLTELARSLVIEPAGDLDVKPFPGASLRPSRPVLLQFRPRDGTR